MIHIFVVHMAMNDSWTTKAQQLATALNNEGSGGRLLRIERVANEFELSPQTVQHLLRAWTFIERLRVEDPTIAKQVAAQSYQGVMALERWYARDRAQMLDYLKTNPAPSVRQLIAAEKAARGLPYRAGMPADHAIEVIRSVQGPILPGTKLSLLLDWAGIEAVDLSKLVWEREAGEYERALGIESNAVGLSVALLVGPSSQTTGHYMRHAKSTWYNAVCAASLFPIVIMLLPSKAAQSTSLTSMPLPPSGERGWPEWNTSTVSRGQPKSGPARPASPNGGIIIFTTPESVCDDWQL